MPWKGEKDPYKIWVSEIILQQTRVEQGLKYYENFIRAFPDIHALARTPDQKIYKLWEGLGYYTRCRNLIETARHISGDLSGNFPRDYDSLKSLRGIGPYTAAAISSFAFNERRAVVDGNVFRVIARIFAVDKPTDSAEGKKFFNHFANKLLDKEKPGLYNQALMDFGAVICKPIPICEQCPFNKSCKAFLNDRIFSFPVKSKKPLVQRRWLNYILMEYRGRFAIRQRIEKDIWHNLFEFLLVEADSELKETELLRKVKQKGWLQTNGFSVMAFSPIFRQQLSHQLIKGRFMKIKLSQKSKLPADVVWVNEKKMKDYAFPKFINQYLQNK